ncbi:UNVERIFIED_CONTAM: hypothetical protein GTU68_025298 [Idotea baltica]|nr:hypothetical protein [Idotea baltica]
MISDVKGKRVLVRVDFNVPLNKEHQITDDTRIRKALPTITSLLDGGASVILMSHLGRPQKKLNDDGSINVQKFSLRHLVNHLKDLTNAEEAFDKAHTLQTGEILLLENTRFHEGESKGDDEMAAKLAKLADIYINDAFGTAHRAHASTATVAKYFKPSNRSLGLLMEAEIQNAKKVLNSPKRPATAILGGAKVSDKILLIERLIDFVNVIIIGGGMSYTFTKAQGGEIGDSLVEDDYMELALKLLKKADEQGVDILLPEDNVIATSFSNDADRKTVKSNQIPENWMGLDIGEKSVETFSKIIKESKTILWNGPVGVFEFENFAKGTQSIARAVADATALGAFSMIGGGDSVAGFL